MRGRNEGAFTFFEKQNKEQKEPITFPVPSRRLHPHLLVLLPCSALHRHSRRLSVDEQRQYRQLVTADTRTIVNLSTSARRLDHAGEQQEFSTYLNSSLDGLHFDGSGFVQSVLFHVDHFPCLAVNSKLVSSLGMFGLVRIDPSQRIARRK